MFIPNLALVIQKAWGVLKTSVTDRQKTPQETCTQTKHVRNFNRQLIVTFKIETSLFVYFIRFKLYDIIPWSLTVQIYQSRQCLLISHCGYEKILMMAFH